MVFFSSLRTKLNYHGILFLRASGHILMSKRGTKGHQDAPNSICITPASAVITGRN